MKKCLKCGTTFADDVNFCPNCGEKLVEVNVCPKCGETVSIGDKFCKKCGAKLTKDEVVKTPVEEKPVEKEVAVDSAEKKEKTKRIMNVIVAAICLFAVAFISIGVFGNLFSIRYDFDSLNKNIGFEYFVKSYPETLGQLSSSIGDSGYYRYLVIMFVIESIFYYGGIIASVILSIFAIIRNIKAIINKSEPNTKLAFAAGASMLPIILFLGARMSIEYKSFLSTSLAWGANMVITGLVFIFIAISTKKIAKAFIEKENIASAFISTAASFLLLIFIFNAFYPIVTVKQVSDIGTATVTTSGIYFAETVMSKYASTGTALSDVEIGSLITGVLSFVFSIMGIAMIYLAYQNSLKDKKISSIIYVGVTYLLVILAGGLSVAAARLYLNDNVNNYNYGLAGGPICALVFLQFALAGLIVSLALTKKKKAE